MESINENPKKSANFLSLIFMSWMNKILFLGRKRTLNGKDLYLLMEEDQTENIVNEIEKFWREELLRSTMLNKKPRLWKVLLKTFPSKMSLMIVMLRCLATISSISIAILVWHFLRILSQSSTIQYRSAIPYMVGITVAGIVKMFSEHHYLYQSHLKGMRLKVAIIGLVYKKSISTCHKDLSNFPTGHILNLVSNDAQRMEESVDSIVMVLVTPIEIIATIVLMWMYIGWQSLSGVIYFAFLLVYNLLASKKIAKLRLKVAAVTDKRLAVLNNVICGIRAVKMYAWEHSFSDVVKRLRSLEMKFIRIRSIILSTFVASYSTTTTTASLISIITLLYSGVHLTSFNIFTLLILLNIANFAVCVGLSASLSGVTDAYVAVERVEEFLTSLSRGSNGMETVPEDSIVFINKHVFRETVDLESCNRIRKSYGKALPKFLRKESWNKDQPVLLRAKLLESTMQERSAVQHLDIDNVSVSWGGLESKCVLQGISINISDGKLVMIGGPVGSGKTSLLMAILGEIPLKTGAISGCGSIAYVSQIPWVFSGTIRDNILFGRPFQQERFNEVVDVCDLQTDLKHFAKGDLSLIGQRGISLSGGQRARVSLARAIYSDADIFLLDDPLSGVDAKVGKKIFEKCICGILGKKLRILVTHQLQYFAKADQIILLKDGQTEYQGPYNELKNAQTLLDDFEIKLDDESNGISTKPNERVDDYKVQKTTDLMADSSNATQDMKVDDEDNIAGQVTWQTYWSFFRAGLPAIIIFLFVLLNLIGQVCLVAPNWWLSKMANMKKAEQSSRTVLGVLGGLIAAALILSITRTFALTFSILRSSENLHDKMTVAIIKSPVLFMDKNPVGRIMNRFSKDIGCLDEQLPVQFGWSTTLCLNFMGVMVLASIVNFWLVVAIVPILIVFFVICWFNLKTRRELKRIEAVRCSPIYAHIADTINGMVVIRSSNKQRDFIEQFTRYQDEHTKAFSLVLSCRQWLGLYLDMLCVIFITCVGTGAMIVTQDAALTGLVITYATAILGETWYGILMYSEVENQMTSAERVMTYTDLPSEPGYSRSSLPPSNWPTNGAVSIQGLSFAYYEGGSRVLEDVDIEVLPQQKVGIAGRTGAGKSSLVAALFRMPDSRGKIVIDGLDLGTLNLQAARKAMAVITQDPVLFAASLRANLDPFNKFEDSAIWTALEEVQLKDKVRDMTGGLDFTLAESGMSLSVGERQLLCLARALLQRSKILIMDEATANVDFKTDSLIQQVIREKFCHCTVLTIAHRLNTIMDYDKVLVLDQGHVVEYDTPRALAGKQDGVFAGLLRNHNNEEHEND